MTGETVIEYLRAAHADTLALAARYAEALALLQGKDVAAVPGAKVARKAAHDKSTKPAPKKKAAKAVTDDEPRTARGKLPTVGVQQVLCDNLKERQRRIGILKENGYERVGPGEPLTAGTYDVRSTGDGDDSAVVLWRMRLDEAAA